MNEIIEIRIGKISTIKFKTCTKFRKDDYITVNYEDRTYNFKVLEIIINNDCFIIALDIGYYNSISEMSNEKASKLIGIKINKVTDKEKIKQIVEESCYI